MRIIPFVFYEYLCYRISLLCLQFKGEDVYLSNMKKTILLLIVICILLATGYISITIIPKQSTVLDQFYYAMDKFYLPASNSTGFKRKFLAQKAVTAFEKVVKYFPESKQTLVIMEAYFYQGMALRELGENNAAVEAFYACFSANVPAVALDSYDANMMNYKDIAWNALMELREYVPMDYLEKIDEYEPMQ